MKKIIMIITVLALVSLTMAGCGQKTIDPQTTTDSTSTVISTDTTSVVK